MGLEINELFMRLEDKFGIEIDDGANDIKTVGELRDYILQKIGCRVEKHPEMLGSLLPARVRYTHNKGCPTPGVFLDVRSRIAGLLGLEEESISPSTPLRAVIGARDLRRVWDALSREGPWEIEPLEASRFAFTAAGLLSGCVAGMSVHYDLMPPIGIGLAVLVLWIVFLFGMMRIAPYGTRIPAELVTVGDLARRVSGTNYEKAYAPGVMPSKQDLFLSIRSEIVLTFGVREDEVREDTRFIEDLGE